MNKGRTMSDWAEREVEIVISSLKKSIKEDDDFKYSKSVYYDALKIYKFIMKQGHSGYSFGALRHILKKLINEMPLSPITGADSEWITCDFMNVSADRQIYQNIRRYSLFKEVYKDGTVKYDDINRIVCLDLNDERYCTRTITDIVNEMFPITMPYEPDSEPYKILTDRICKDKDMGFIVYSVVTPKGETIDINKFFIRHNNEFTELTEFEFSKRFGFELT